MITLFVLALPFVPQLVAGVGATAAALGLGYFSRKANEDLQKQNQEKIEAQMKEDAIRMMASRNSTGRNTSTRRTRRTSTATPAPNPQNDNDSTKVQWYKKPWETAKNSQGTSAWGRGLRNFGIRVPAYTGAAAPVLDLAGNAIGASREESNVVHKLTFPLTRSRFALEKGAFKLIGDQYSTKVSYDPSYQETDSSIEAPQNPTVPVDTFTRIPIVPDTSRVNNGIVFVTGQ